MAARLRLAQRPLGAHRPYRERRRRRRARSCRRFLARQTSQEQACQYACSQPQPAQGVNAVAKPFVGLGTLGEDLVAWVFEVVPVEPTVAVRVLTVLPQAACIQLMGGILTGGSIAAFA